MTQPRMILIKSMITLVLMALVLFVISVDAKERKTYAMSLNVFQAVEKVNEQVELEQYEVALELLADIKGKRLTDNDKAQISYLKGSIYYQMGNTDLAITAFADVLQYEGKTQQILLERTVLTLSQLSLVNQHYEDAEMYASKLLSLKKFPSAEDHSLYAQILFKTEKFEKSLEQSKLSRQISDKMQQKPKENLLLLQNAIYYELKQLENMVLVLEDLIKFYPKANYVLFLASIHGQLDHLDKQTVLMESLYENGQLDKGSQMLNLASLYLSEKVPVKAAQLLEKEIQAGNIEKTHRNYNMLSQAWRLASEDQQALVALNEAARLSEDGNTYLQKAYLHYDLMEWQASSQAISLALDKGLEDKQRAEAWLLKGMVLLNLNQFADAINACDKARDHQKTAKTAVQWIKYIESEQKKYQALSGV